MRIAILQGGGTCPGTNAAIAGARDGVMFAGQGAELLGIPHGYKGLVTPQEFRPIGAWVQKLWKGNRRASLEEQAGCILGTSRENPLESWEESKRRIAENIAKNRISALLAIGGDDTIAVAQRLSLENVVPTNGIAKTIDYDLSAPSFGFDTAAHNGHTFVTNMRTEAQNFCTVGVIEAMGRDAGWLARAHQNPLNPYDDSNADAVLLPEYEVVKDTIVERMRQKMREQGHAVLVVAEGFRINGQQTYLSKNEELDPHGHRRLGGVRFRIEQWLNAADMKTMQLAPGYLYRSGKPTPHDQAIAYGFGYLAAESLFAGNAGKVATQDPKTGTLTLVPMESIHGGKFVPPELYDAELLQRKD